PSIILSDTIWEGIVTVPNRNKIGLGSAEARVQARTPRAASDLSSIGLELAPMKILAIPRHVTRALEWMQLARASPVRVDTLAHLWFALIALVRFGQPKGATDKSRIQAYLAQLRSGAGGHPVLGRARIDALEALFRKAEQAR